jgi:hypothetical protein
MTKNAYKYSRSGPNPGDEHGIRFQSQTYSPTGDDVSVLNAATARVQHWVIHKRHSHTMRMCGKDKGTAPDMQLVSFMLRPPCPRYPHRHKGKRIYWLSAKFLFLYRLWPRSCTLHPVTLLTNIHVRKIAHVLPLPAFHAQDKSRMRISVGESRLRCLWDAMMANRGVGIRSVFETKYMGEAHATCIRLKFSRGHQPAWCVFALIMDDIYLDGYTVFGHCKCEIIYVSIGQVD